MKRMEVAAVQQATNTLRLFRNLGARVMPRISAAVIVAGIACLLSIALAPPMRAQIYDGTQMQTTTQPKKKTPLDLVLRSIAVLEWTGPAGKPTASLLIPITVYTDDQYMDGGDYLPQPVPLAVQRGTQYVLEQSGVPQGDYDLNAAGKLRGAWFGSGSWEPLHAKNPYALNADDSGRPHFGAQTDAPPQPKLPTLHRRPSPDAAKVPPPDPNRPVMAYGNPPQPQSLASLSDAPTAHRQQMVAVSDAATRPVHSLAYPWSNPAQKIVMQQKMEAQAQAVLQQALKPKKIAAPPAPAPAPSTPKLVKRPKPQPATHATTAAVATPNAPTLTTVYFHCFALEYENNPSQATPTCVLDAETPAGSTPQRYVTVIAQPDIYGAPQMISKAESDATKLDTHPRVEFIDAVDASANHHAELLFQVDEATQRQFALYQVKDGKVTLAYITAKLPF